MTFVFFVAPFAVLVLVCVVCDGRRVARERRELERRFPS